MRLMWSACAQLVLLLCFADRLLAEKNIICYYDSGSYLREGYAKLMPSDLEVALDFCTHLMYGYAGLKPETQEVFSLNVDLDMFHYSEITLLKVKHPQLKVFLSVGGDRDIDDEHPLKYIELLECGREAQQNFIDSAIAILRRNGFDGLDLAFQFPRNKPRKVHNTLGAYWKKFKKLFTGDFIVDQNAEDHKQQYTTFAQRLRAIFNMANLSLSMTVLPNVNSTWYFDVPNIHNSFDFITLAAFDFLTPERNPDEADYTAPIYEPPEQNRLPHYNVAFQVNYWLDNKCPPNKLHLGVASYGRAWQLSESSGVTGAPVVSYTEGPADAGPWSRTPGLLGWPEICRRASPPATAHYRGAEAPFRKVIDLEQKYGNYMVRPSDEMGEYGEWISYDDPDFVGVKTMYAQSKRLGGIALFHLGEDDPQGSCTNGSVIAAQKFPFLRTIKYNL